MTYRIDYAERAIPALADFYERFLVYNPTKTVDDIRRVVAEAFEPIRLAPRLRPLAAGVKGRE